MAFPQVSSPATPVLYHVKRVHMVTVKRNSRQHTFRASCVIGLALALVLSLLWVITTEATGLVDIDSLDASMREE